MTSGERPLNSGTEDTTRLNISSAMDAAIAGGHASSSAGRSTLVLFVQVSLKCSITFIRNPFGSFFSASHARRCRSRKLVALSVELMDIEMVVIRPATRPRMMSRMSSAKTPKARSCVVSPASRAFKT